MKKRWFGKGSHIDEEKLKAQAQAESQMKLLLQTGDEEGYIAYLKRMRPGLTSEQLVSLVEKFRELRRDRARRSGP